MTDEFATLDATAQAELVRTGQVTPLELVDAAINRVEKLNPDLNAVIPPASGGSQGRRGVAAGRAVHRCAHPVQGPRVCGPG
jgi:amidase